jgi:hypothetical protein
MRKLVLGIAVLAAVGLWPAAASALPRSGSVADAQDQKPSIQGRRLPDVRAVRATYDPDLNQFTIAFELQDPLGYDGVYDAAYPSFSVGTSAGPDGRCITGAVKGDFSFYGNVYGYPLGTGASGSLTAVDYVGSIFTGGVVSADRKTITYNLNGITALANRDYNCVGNISLYSGGANDEISDFYLGNYKPPAPPDAIAPTAAFVHPVNNEHVAGIWTEGDVPGKHNCLVSASDNIGIKHATFFLDGDFLNEQVNPPWSCEWDTRTTGNGSHTLSVTVYDAVGNSTSKSINVVVDNAAAVDKTAPTATFLAPTDGQRISGVWNEGGSNGGHNCQVDAKDDVGVVGAQFKVDNAFLNQEVGQPWSCVWDTAATPDGPHVLSTSVWDAAGNTTTRSITVIVDNVPDDAGSGGTPPPPPPITVVTPPDTGGGATASKPDKTPPVIAVLAKTSQKIAGALSTGILAPVRCDEACSFVVTAKISRGQARKLHWRTRKTWLTIGTGREDLPGAGKANALVEITPLAVSRLRHARRVSVVLDVRVVDGAGNVSTGRRSITLKR